MFLRTSGCVQNSRHAEKPNRRIGKDAIRKKRAYQGVAKETFKLSMLAALPTPGMAHPSPTEFGISNFEISS